MTRIVVYPTFETTHYPSAGPTGGWVSTVLYYHSKVQVHQLDLVWHQHRAVGRVWAGWTVLKALWADVSNRPVCWCDRAKLSPNPFDEYEAYVMAKPNLYDWEAEDDV